MRAALATQARVIGALILREARTRYGKTQLGYLLAFAEPIAVVGTLTLLSMIMRQLPPHGNSLPIFFALGSLSYMFYRRVAGFCVGAFDANQALLNYPIVQRVDTVIARTALEAITCMLVSVIIIGGLIVFTDQPRPARLELMAAAATLLVMVGFGWGTLSAVIGEYFASWRTLEPLVTRPLFLLSGIFFVPDRMPPLLVSYLSWNPIMHGIELMRSGYYAGYRSQALDTVYLFYWAFGLTVIGLAAERAVRMREAGSGALGAAQ